MQLKILLLNVLISSGLVELDGLSCFLIHEFCQWWYIEL